MQPPRSSVIGGICFAIAAALWALASWFTYRNPELRTLALIKDIFLILVAGALLGWIILANSRRVRELERERTEGDRDLERWRSHLRVLIEAVDRLNSEASLASTLESICREAAKALGVEAATITTYRPERGAIEPAATYGLPKVFLQHFQPIAHSGSTLQAAPVGRPFTFVDGGDGLVAIPYGPLYREAGYTGAAYMPLHDESGFLGELTVLVGDHKSHEFKSEDLSLLKAFADEASMAIRNERLKTQTKEHSRKLQTLREGDLAILSSLDLSLTLRLFLSAVIDQLDADAADVLLLSPASNTLEYASGLGFLTKALQASKVALGTGFAGKIAQERRSMYVADVKAAAPFTRRELILEEGAISYFGTPLIAKGRLLGVLEVYHRRPFFPADSWLSFVETLAGQAAIAIDNAELFTNLQQTNLNLSLAYDRTLEGWSRALDLRDRETEGHTERVTELCVHLAEEFNLLDEDLVHIRRGALLHDIGKMGVSDEILRKPGQLNQDDEQVMRQHPTLAYEMLSPITFLQPAIDIPYCHHERWDGTGYPRGLKGEVIPLAARIFAVVDVWDALTNDRPYRKAIPKAEAVQHLRDQAGKQFDPSVVDAFLEMLQSQVN